MEIYVITRN